MLLPYEEGYYSAVAMMMALAGQPVNGYINLKDLPSVTDGPDTILITKANADKFKPKW